MTTTDNVERLNAVNVDDRDVNGRHVDVRYDEADFESDDFLVSDGNVLVVDCASAHTRYTFVITRLHGWTGANKYVIALVNLSPRGFVWDLPRLGGWHPSYLAKNTNDMNEVTASTVAQILDDIERAFPEF